MAGSRPANPGALQLHIELWLNLVEVWFGMIERQAIRRGVVLSVQDLVGKIRDFVTGWNR